MIKISDSSLVQNTFFSDLVKLLNNLPFLGTTFLIELKFGMHKLEVLTQHSTRSTRPRAFPQSRAISTGSDLGRPPYELAG